MCCEAAVLVVGNLDTSQICEKLGWSNANCLRLQISAAMSKVEGEKEYILCYKTLKGSVQVNKCFIVLFWKWTFGHVSPVQFV